MVKAVPTGLALMRWFGSGSYFRKVCISSPIRTLFSSALKVVRSICCIEDFQSSLRFGLTSSHDEISNAQDLLIAGRVLYLFLTHSLNRSAMYGAEEL